MTLAHATPAAWGRNLQHPCYATDETYRLAAEWLSVCATVADWGGGPGYLRKFLPAAVRYWTVDGTPQGGPGEVIADLSTYREPADGIVLRHVLDQAEDWQAVLRNALASFRRRLVVITFTSDAETTTVAKRKSGWPVRRFNPRDLRAAMGACLVSDSVFHTSHPEHVYCLERP